MKKLLNLATIILILACVLRQQELRRHANVSFDFPTSAVAMGRYPRPISSTPTPTATATATGTPTPTPTGTPALVYTKGVWASIGGGNTIPDALKNNKGIVGVGITSNWSEIETSDNHYGWNSLDVKIANAKSAGFDHIGLAVTDSLNDPPGWLRDEIKADGKTIPMLDPGANHSTYCQPIDTPLPWGTRFHAKRLALIAAMGAHYSSDSAITAVFASFCNHNSMDWNIEDTIGTLSPDCGSRACPNDIVDTNCISKVDHTGGTCTVGVDQPAQWLSASDPWTRAKMLQVGKDICDAVATAFPRQNIKLPIGGLADPLASSGSAGVYSTLAQEIQTYVNGRPYASRFFIQRNTVDTNWGLAATFLPPNSPPGPGSERYLKYMVAAAVPKSGLQTVAFASSCIAGQACRQNGNRVCTSSRQVMQDSINVMLSYHTQFIEVWPQDAQNPSFYDMIKAATIAMGGTPRP